MLKQLNTQLIRVNLVWGGAERRRQAPARQPDEPERPGLRLVGLRPHRLLRAAERDQGRLLDRRDAAVGERREGRQRRARRTRSTSSASRPPRRARYSGTFKATDGRILPPVRQLARLERAEQPGLPAAAVQEGQGQGRDPERDRLREDLQRGRQGRPQDHGRRVEGRVRRHRPARQQQPELVPARRVAAAVPARDEEGGREGLRRLRAPPVLRRPARDAEHAAAARDPRQRADRDHARQHQPPHPRGHAPVREQADLDHRVRLPDQPARPDLRRLVR